MNYKEHILLLVGGASAEREVSKRSSKAIFSARSELGYHISLLDPAYGKNQPREIDAYFAEKDCFPVTAENYLAAFDSLLVKEADIVFIGLHGQFGEDGTVQALLELMNKKYTGSKVLSSSLSMDKHNAKIIMKEHKVDSPKEIFLPSSKYSADFVIRQIQEEFGFPCVVKPNNQGSTCGLSVCYDASEVASALNMAFQFSKAVLIEEFIKGSEITAGIIDYFVLPVLEIRPKHELYDYECKYTQGMTEYFVPAEISPEITFEIQDQTSRAFKALGCIGYARADFRLSETGQIYCLEINTLPGMTATSLFPKMAKAAGISFNQLIENIILSGLK